MILRPFIAENWQVISRDQYPGMPEADAKALIAQWETKQYDGRYFEQLAIDVDGQIVGFVSLQAQPNGTVSDGIEIYPPFRRNGYACAALKLLICFAHELGYSTMAAQIRQDNEASLALHRKLGFSITGEFVNKRGKPVYSLSLVL